MIDEYTPQPALSHPFPPHPGCAFPPLNCSGTFVPLTVICENAAEAVFNKGSTPLVPSPSLQPGLSNRITTIYFRTAV